MARLMAVGTDRAEQEFSRAELKGCEMFHLVTVPKYLF